MRPGGTATSLAQSRCEHRLGVRPLEQELGERRLVEDRDRLAHGPVLGRRRRETSSAAEGVAGLRLARPRGANQLARSQPILDPKQRAAARRAGRAAASGAAARRSRARGFGKRDGVVHAHDLSTCARAGTPVAVEAARSGGCRRARGPSAAGRRRSTRRAPARRPPAARCRPS